MSTVPIKTEEVASEPLPPIPDVVAVTANSLLSVPVPNVSEPAEADPVVPTTIAVALPAVAPATSAAIRPPSVSLPTSAPSSAAASVLANKTKSKKKKHQVPPVTMATAAAAAAGSPGAQGENTGRWTAEEHRLFLQGLEQHGKGWKKIASLIKSRTVVQIRTHAQKYFQKLAKARQNGEDGDVSMEGQGGTTPVPMSTTSMQSSKRRRQTTGTKRKAISSVVASAQRQGKRMAAAQAAAGVSSPTHPLPSITPALQPFVPQATFPSITTAHGTISGPALEDSLFRFLTPAPMAAPDLTQVNDVARQAGANKITVPSGTTTSNSAAADGEVSPTGVNDLVMYPSWTDAKDVPTWYAKGADVDCLLDVADTLDWLTDTGDLNETYEPPKEVTAVAPLPEEEEDEFIQPPHLSTDALAAMDSYAPVAALPSLFENTDASKKHDAGLDEHLSVFDTPMEEHAFVSALLENNGESSGSLPVFS